MKTVKFKILFLLTFVAFVFYACDKQLDIEPEQEISSDVVYSSSDGIINALYGAYAQISGSMLDGDGGELFGGTSYFFPELVGDDGKCMWGGTFIEYRNMFNKALDPSDFTVEDHWSRGYQAINIINNVLANLETVVEREQDLVEGEAKFVRAMVYFDLLRLYALPYEAGAANSQLGVPLVTTPTLEINDDCYVSRNTVAEGYNLVLQDLETAQTKLTAAEAIAPADNGGRASAMAASALLARVYLQMGNFAKAAEKANAVIESELFMLNSTPRSAFNNDDYTSEDIFMIKQNAQSNAGQSNEGCATFFASLPGMGRGDLVITPAFFTIFETGDLRATIQENMDGVADISGVNKMYYIGNGQNGGSTMCAKWGKYDAYLPVIRLAEMYLIRAEANFQNSTQIGDTPINDIAAIRDRAGLTTEVPATIELIRLERKRELAWEGHRLHDAKRWKENIGDLPYNDNSLVLPIPQREIDVNENLQQNPGYIQ